MVLSLSIKLFSIRAVASGSVFIVGGRSGVFYLIRVNVVPKYLIHLLEPPDLIFLRIQWAFFAIASNIKLFFHVSLSPLATCVRNE